MKTTIDAAQIDRLGLLMAQISDLSKEANEIKSALKERGKGVVAGNLFQAVVIPQDRITYDTEILQLVAPPEILELAERRSSNMQVRVTARKAV